MSAISDLTLSTLQQALRGVGARREAVGDNIANVETPGFLANRVSFEASLARAVESGDPSSMRLSATRSTDPTRLNGNNVNLDDEMVLLTQNQLQGQLVSEALNAKYRLLRTAITGS
jgi:flagellar basal-body rod protein FlgB